MSYPCPNGCGKCYAKEDGKPMLKHIAICTGKVDKKEKKEKKASDMMDIEKVNPVLKPVAKDWNKYFRPSLTNYTPKEGKELKSEYRYVLERCGKPLANGKAYYKLSKWSNMIPSFKDDMKMFYDNPELHVTRDEKGEVIREKGSINFISNKVHIGRGATIQCPDNMWGEYVGGPPTFGRTQMVLNKMIFTGEHTASDCVQLAGRVAGYQYYDANTEVYTIPRNVEEIKKWITLEENILKIAKEKALPGEGILTMMKRLKMMDNPDMKPAGSFLWDDKFVQKHKFLTSDKKEAGIDIEVEDDGFDTCEGFKIIEGNYSDTDSDEEEGVEEKWSREDGTLRDLAKMEEKFQRWSKPNCSSNISKLMKYIKPSVKYNGEDIEKYVRVYDVSVQHSRTLGVIFEKKDGMYILIEKYNNLHKKYF